MHRYLTPDHFELQTRVRRFAQEAIVPVARELDETAEFPWENVKIMAEMGLLGVPVPDIPYPNSNSTKAFQNEFLTT